MRKRVTSALLVLAVAAGLVGSPAVTSAANPQLTVDLSQNTGALLYGATGFLYGLGNDGIPKDNMLAPLKPQYASQKPPGGLQHPNGDVFEVQDQYFRNGGKEIQVIMQDIYKEWPYENLGMNDYLAKVDTMVRALNANPNRDKYVYVPFNEPDWIWYNNSTKLQQLFNDWKTVYQKIRSIVPNAKIAGIGFSYYDANVYDQFLTFAKNNDCLPDVTTWHELQNSFFTDWDTHYNHYRSVESRLGISPRPISINEYGRFSGDIPVPGNLVQFVSKFENSKVYGSLAYWTTAGALNDLATENNKATGGWWLYKWYGDLSGNTVKTTPPSPSGSLQGVAALNATDRQARILFGGSLNASDVFATDVVVKGFGTASYFGSTVHAVVMGIDNTNLNPSSGPYVLQEGDYNVVNGQITVPVSNMKALSAYQMIITPNRDLSPSGTAGRYEAEYAAYTGTAFVSSSSNTGYSGTSFLEGFGGGGNSASGQFVVTAPTDGYYDLSLRYSAGPLAGAPANRTIRMTVGGTTLKDLTLGGTANWDSWATSTTKVFLEAGINRIGFTTYTADNSDAVNLDYLEVAAATDTVVAYEAEAAGNTLTGTAKVESKTAASGGKYVSWIGNGAANALQFNGIQAPSAGRYRIVVTYANGELGDGATNYNSNIVDRYADVSVNGGGSQKVYFRNTLGWSNFRTTVIDVNLNAGANTIKFSNGSIGFAPDIDRIQVAAYLGN
ncbi:carbohydrate-binding protein [Paenibacillus sedimenti]|uniref:Carbohydrate-binding protein n=1 Tax=Paenibacillus sedimenti TaxID=2770274 RepID=A0A926QKF1_9BACL|nr:CBM35 domain-containing protein [Paenibacillus sedimenti]MBD0382540.1 carbohydrate-binding protein [Paenibacillus sedimenti]